MSHFRTWATHNAHIANTYLTKNWKKIYEYIPQLRGHVLLHSITYSSHYKIIPYMFLIKIQRALWRKWNSLSYNLYLRLESTIILSVGSIINHLKYINSYVVLEMYYICFVFVQIVWNFTAVTIMWMLMVLHS